MSSSDGATINSRPSQAKCQNPSRLAVSKSLPTPEDRTNEFFELYPEKAEAFLYQEGAEDPREAYDRDGPASVTVRAELVEETDGGERYTVTWGAAVRRFLEWVEDRRDVWGRFQHADGDVFEKRLIHSYDPEYLETDYAKLKGLGREIEKLENPGVALLTLTASGTYANGEPRGPVDHQLERRRAWEPTRKALWYQMEKYREQGRINDWGYVVVEEQHPGKGLGKNAGLGHDHPYIWFDGELSADDFRPVISTWIDECESASRDAHDLDNPDPEKRPVDVRNVDPEAEASRENIRSVASYITKYLYPDEGDKDPLERPIERTMYEALKWATNTRRLRKSDNSNQAIAADLCRQKAERVDGRPGHGERLRHNDGRGPSLVCGECGSSWGVEEAEAETIVEARLRDGAGASASEASDSWGAGASGARIRDGRIESYENEPARETGWRMEAVVVDGEEHEPGGGGVELRTVQGINQIWQNTDSVRDALEHRRDRDRRGEAPARPELPEPGGWSDVEKPARRGGSRYSVLHEPTQAERMKIVRRAARELEGIGGAEESEIIARAHEAGVSTDKAARAVHQLKQRGVLYEIAEGRLRYA